MSGLEIAIWVLVGGIGALLAAEVAARVWLRRFSRRNPFIPGSRQHFKLNQEAVPRLEPEIWFEISKEGVRSNGGLSPKPGDCCMMVAGGSAAEGFLLNWETSWAGVIEAELNKPKNLKKLGAPRVHMGSVGRSRTGAPAMKAIFENLLPRYPRVHSLIVMAGATDMVDWLEIGAPEEWKSPDPDESAMFPHHRKKELGWHPKKTALFELLKRSRERFLRPVSQRENVGGRLKAVRIMRRQRQGTIDDLPNPTAMLDAYEQTLREALKMASKYVDNIVIVRQPTCWIRPMPEDVLAQCWNMGVGNPYHKQVTHYYSHDLVGNLLERVNDRANIVAEELGCEVIDLMPHLERSVDAYYDMIHFTPVGARQIGELVANRIAENPNPPPRYQANDQTYPCGRITCPSDS